MMSSIQNWVLLFLFTRVMLGIDEQKEIAYTIVSQIKYADVWFLPAIGATKFTALNESKEYRGGIRFNCNGLRHKGIVEILLKWIDTYTVRFLDEQENEIKSVSDVYCDELVPVLDYVEGN